jgi:hypothetical protein
MNPILDQNCHVNATPTKPSPVSVVDPRFLVELHFCHDAAPLRLEAVHLRNKAQRLISSGRVTGLIIEALMLSSLPASLLCNPHLLATAIELDSSECLRSATCASEDAELRAGFRCSFGDRDAWLVYLERTPLLCGLFVIATPAARSFLRIPACCFTTLDEFTSSLPHLSGHSTPTP